MDLTQAVLLSVIVVLTIFLVVIGLQAFFALKDLRRTLAKMNKLMADADDLVDQVKKPIESTGHFITALTAGAGIAHFLKRNKKDKAKHE
ncbi:hypothetical protein A2164_01615 [Candidatus Curtissbacteria bacterium RBG_13_35_7]|uniref:Uncharacterized protein n=1 Tax=Candidatus Curtissbacteria bacterium RBG_13_35_7 TaxID=1797705 RepID=A0A1F5G2V3_9BACT|nr:MAG: hypothetical protein A2164_01615 [Candidatus Curtissbacteria bacterium RBG_13_35_7]